MLKNSSYSLICINSNNSNNVLTEISHKSVGLYNLLLLKNSLINNFFTVDGLITLNKNKKNFYITFSCVQTNERYSLLLMTHDMTNLFSSLTSLFRSFIWVERELAEFNSVQFKNLTDSRRLLTDYLNHNLLNTTAYKLVSYDQIIQDLTVRLLHWLFFYSFCIILVLLSFYSFNYSLLHLILLGEILIILLAVLSGILLLSFNIYTMIGLATLLLIFGGLELSLNLLFLAI